jgi:hypothetical protein
LGGQQLRCTGKNHADADKTDSSAKLLATTQACLQLLRGTTCQRQFLRKPPSSRTKNNGRSNQRNTNQNLACATASTSQHGRNADFFALTCWVVDFV